MAADQVQEKPKESDAKASDSAAGKPAETPKNEVKAAEQGANDKMQQEVSGQPDAAKDTAGTATKDATDANEAAVSESQTTRDKLTADANLTSPDANLATADIRAAGADAAQRALTDVKVDGAATGNPSESVIDGVKAFELTGKSRLAEGETKKYDDLKILHDGKVLLDFDDADILQNQWSANIDLKLPENAKNETIDGVGTRSLIQDKDGGTTEVIKADDGSVYIRQGDQYYAAKTGFYGQVIEGKEAKEAFESKSEEFGAGAKVMNHSAVSATNAISIQQKDGTELVSVDKDGKVDTKIPGDAFIIAGADGQRAILTDGTQMVKSDNGTTILNSDGRVIQVGTDGKVQEFARGDAAGQAAWKAEAGRFESDVKPTGTDGAFALSDTFDFSSWFPSDLGKSFNFTNFDFDNFDWGDTTSLMGDPIFGQDFKTFASEDLTCKVDPNFDLSKLDLKDFLLDKAVDYTDKKATAIEDKALDGGTEVPKEEAQKALGDRLSQITLADGSQASFDLMKMASKGLSGDSVEESRKGSEIAQHDQKTGITRIENTETGEVTLSYQDDSNPKNSFFLEATLDKGDKSVTNAKAVFDDSIITKQGESYSMAKFGDAGDLEYRLENSSLKNEKSLSTNEGQRELEQRFSSIKLKDGSPASFDANTLLTEGLKGDGVTSTRRGDEIAQHDPKTGLTRMENTKTGEVTLSYRDPEHPENSFHMEAHRGPDGKIARSKTAFNDGVITREGDNYTQAEFADRSLTQSGNAVTLRLKGQALSSEAIFGNSEAPFAAIQGDNGAAVRNNRLALGRVTDADVPGTPDADPDKSSVLELFTKGDGPGRHNRVFFDPDSNAFFRRGEGGKREVISATELAEKGIRIEERDGNKFLIDTTTGEPAFKLTPNRWGKYTVSALDHGVERARAEEEAPGVFKTTAIDTRPKSKDDPTAGSTIVDTTDTNTGKATQTVTNGDGSVKINSDIDLATGNRVDRDAKGNVVAEFRFNQNGQVDYRSADFNKDFGFNVTNDNGYVFNGNGDITDSDGDNIFSYSSGAFNEGDGWSSEAYERALYGGMTFAEYKEAEARGNQEAAIASSSFGAALAISMSGRVDMGAINFARSQLSALQALPVLTNAVISAIGYGQSAVATGESVRHGTDEIQKVATGIKDSYIVAQVGKEIAGGNSVNIRSVVLKTLRRVNPEHEWVRNEFSPDYIKGLHGDRNSDIA